MRFGIDTLACKWVKPVLFFCVNYFNCLFTTYLKASTHDCGCTAIFNVFKLWNYFPVDHKESTEEPLQIFLTGKKYILFTLH